MNFVGQAPTSADWDALVAEVKGATAVLCVAHVSPDGDALGSAMAAALAMRQVGIEAYVSFDEEPFRLPASLAWLPGQELLRAPSQLPPTIDVVVSFDASDLARLGSLGAVGNAAAMFAAVDHHRSYTGFGTLSLVDVTAPATAVLALELADRLEAELTTDIATCIYAGLTTDTGSFRFPARRPRRTTRLRGCTKRDCPRQDRAGGIRHSVILGGQTPGHRARAGEAHPSSGWGNGLRGRS